MRCVAIVASALAQLGFVEAEGLEQQGAGDGQAFDRGFAGNHESRPRRREQWQDPQSFTDLYGRSVGGPLSVPL